jgi:hypothetical protein
MKIGVLVNAFARTTELYECLSSVLAATQKVTDTRLIIHQEGIDESMKVTNQFRNSFDVKFVIPASNNALDCINRNRILGLEILFDEVKVDAVLGIEDDVEISKDSGEFCKSILEQYYGDRNFRGINLGSRNAKSDNLEELNTFSLIRYGLHGQAGLITRQTWRYIREKKLGVKSTSGFDAQIEGYLKTGFMATSNYSRYLDRGYDLHATHANRNPNDISFLGIAESYVGRNFVPKCHVYTLNQLNHLSWRSDAKAYIPIENLAFWIKFKGRDYLSGLKR